jgi:DNA-binding NarL/FixJ family response regulator
MKRIRVFLADDHGLLLEAFTSLLEPFCDVVGTATDGREVLERAPAVRPDVVVMDIRMPNLNGIEAASLLAAQLPHARVIFLTANEDPHVAVRAIRAGAAGYLTKKEAGRELVRAIECAASQQTYISPSVAGEVVARIGRDDGGPVLTTRQREVLQLLAEGRTMKEIAAELGITPRTVAHHKDVLKERLGVSTTADLVRYACSQGIVLP